MSARKSLEQLFDLLFGAADLKRFLENGVSAAVAAEFQKDSSDLANRASRLVEVLQLHGAVTDELFDRLATAFPERAADIESVARQFLPGRSARPGSAVPQPHRELSELPADGNWDVFLAHAGPDGAAADQLYELLSDQGLDVFLDSRCLQLGQRWDDVIPRALTGARLVVVLVSEQTRDAWYAREEIAMAIDVSRRPGSNTRVVPVYLAGLPEDSKDWLYGLKRLQGLTAARVGWPEGVVRQLGNALEDGFVVGNGARMSQADLDDSTPAQAVSTEPSQSTFPTYLHYFNVAMDLDRSEQWQGLVKESRSDQSGIFMVYGERRQNVELFVARLWNYLNAETDRHHKVISVPSRWETELPRSAAGWEINLGRALGEGEGTAAERLCEMARHQPVFLVFCEYPLSRDGLDDDEEVIAALEAFLDHRLPALIQRCSTGHPIRALLVTDYECDAESMEARLHAKIQRGAKQSGIRYRRLKEVEHVRWSHVKAYLDSLDPAPPSSVYRAIENEYERLDHERISFQELADRLSRKL